MPAGFIFGHHFFAVFDDLADHVVEFLDRLIQVNK